MDTSADDSLTETDVENFAGFMSFIAKNDLWRDAEKALEAAGITSIHVSSKPIQVIREMINDDLLPNDRLDHAGRKHALVIAECFCGPPAKPGPFGQGPQFPTGGGDAGVPPDAGTVQPQ